MQASRLRPCPPSLSILHPSPLQDRVIGKKVFKVRGTISANNWLRVPRLRTATLGLTGRFLYLQVQHRPCLQAMSSPFLHQHQPFMPQGFQSAPAM